jgi:glycolate oxidase iron-sulfur subunit
MDSPRGRINLMAQRLEGEPLSPSMVQHFDQCLGCMACVTACPSGVKYDELITRTRADIPARGFLFHLFPYPHRLRLLKWPMRAYQAVTRGRRLFARWPRLGTLESLMPRVTKRPAAGVRVHGPRRAVVGMLTGCVQRAFFPHVNAATERVLTAEGCEVLPFPRQGCCGALSLHNGRTAEAERFARKLIDAVDVDRIDYFVVNAAGCGSALKEYGSLLAADPAYAVKAKAFAGKVRDLSEMLVELGPLAPREPLPETVLYHDACHLAHAQGVRTQPRVLLKRIPGLDVREIAEAEICCGSAGVWNIQHPEPARELGERKARAIIATGATTVVTANPGCLMQIAAALERLGATVKVVHTAELLDSTISRRD